jgi:hypothetical protein
MRRQAWAVTNWRRTRNGGPVHNPAVFTLREQALLIDNFEETLLELGQAEALEVVGWLGYVAAPVLDGVLATCSSSA